MKQAIHPLFDPASHTYHLGDRVLPSVTEIIEAVIPRKWNPDPWYMQRGSMVHRACALLLRGELDEASLDPRIAGQMRAARAVMAAYPTILGDAIGQGGIIEQPLADPVRGFAGTPDYISGAGVLVDWKASVEPTVEPQLGGYAMAAGITRGRCMAVELREDGTFQVTEFDVARCRGIFLNVLTVWQWKQHHGLKAKGGIRWRT